MTTYKGTLLTLIMLGAALGSFTTQSFAQVSPERKAAIIKCTKQAHMAYPDEDPSAHHGRYSAYEACMTTAGQLP